MSVIALGKSETGRERTKVAVLRPPHDEEWGARTFDLLDPSGNTIFVMGPVSEESTY